MKVLFISAWYPNRYDELYGVFVQRHAEAVSLHAQVEVLYVHPDSTIDSFETVVRQHKNIKETIVYFPAATNNFLSKIKKQINYLRAYILGWKLITSSGFRPQLIHANILTRTGFIAYCIKRLTKTPYIITEHWSRYLPIRDEYHGIVRKALTKLVVKNAEAALPVSINLKLAMEKHQLINKNYFVINNTVNNCFLTDHPKAERNKKRILHVSSFDEKAKNIKGMLNAVENLVKIRTDFELVLIGYSKEYDDIFNYSKQLSIPQGTIVFLGEKDPNQVAKELHNADFFVLFSNYENSPVVISESLCCGKPMVSTNVGGISEHINETNGILIPAGDEKALTESLNYMLDHFQEYDAVLIKQQSIKKYSMQSVGANLYSIYQQILAN